MSNLVQAIPEPVLTAFWPLIAVGIGGVVFWRLFRWFIDQVRAEINAAIDGRAFQRVVDERVSAAFQGALAPIMTAHGELAGKVATAQNTADAAHRRIDQYLEKRSA